MKTNKLRDFFENQDFKVHLTKQDNVQCAEIETWTEGGVNMVIWLNPFTVEEFKDYVNDFDIDEQVELHRQDKEYRNNFTMRQGLNDFEEFHDLLKATLEQLEQSIKIK